MRSNKHNPIMNALKYAPHKSICIQQALMKKTTLLLSCISIVISIWFTFLIPPQQGPVSIPFLIHYVRGKNRSWICIWPFAWYLYFILVMILINMTATKSLCIYMISNDIRFFVYTQDIDIHKKCLLNF